MRLKCITEQLNLINLLTLEESRKCHDPEKEKRKESRTYEPLISTSSFEN